jgi:hypothetical protein
MTGLFPKLKETFISLIVWAIVAVGGLLYFNVGHKPPSTRPPVTPSSEIDFRGYLATYDRLAGQASEQEAFVRSMKGRKVRWHGYVSYVRNSDVSRSKIALAITPTPTDQPRLAVVYFGENMRDRLFRLRENDAVEVTGTFDSDSWHTPYIQGDALQPLPQVPTTPPDLPAAQGS